ncbi:alpha/beta-hydrolase [Gonapodya prolifera JEL478]|uniref:Alpha/beta-hydrolase n=1 Tax=Gonapodya prolifera (strain JEL478) TaxID=1344416 RepID=A0A138ZXD7_GONPJ|nr:alpha/beta-hydrolase [Gonapodya prolifera JEL478]|eukprot:KXS09124.1 alpha/beta-hydrolase [Gonapodya prolifera JEL478]
MTGTYPPIPKVASTSVTMTSKIAKGHVRVCERRPRGPVDIYYELHGEGKRKVMFIPGFNVPCQGWDLQTKFFGEMPEYQAMTFDNRGAGFSSCPPGPYSTYEMAMDAFELMQALGDDWKEGVHGVGICMGGQILQELALICPPGTFASLTLITTSAGSWPSVQQMITLYRFLSEPDPLQRLHKLVDSLYTAEWLEQSPTSSYALKAIEQDGKDYKTNRDWSFDLILQRRARSPAGHPAGTLPQIIAFNLHNVSRDRLRRIRELIPEILVVTGSKDDVMYPSNSQYLADQLHGTLLNFEGCGHSPFIERCDDANAKLLEHIERAQTRFEKNREKGAKPAKVNDQKSWKEVHEESPVFANELALACI